MRTYDLRAGAQHGARGGARRRGGRKAIGGSEAIAADERGWAADLPGVTGALELRHGSRLPRGGYLRCGHWADL